MKRGLKVLALLNQVETIGVSELARLLGLPRTTAERILLTLAAEGYVERVPDDRRYRLSAKVCDLAMGFSDDSWIIHVATPLLFDTTRRIGWPLAIATPRGDQMVVRVTTDPATSLWLHRRRIGSETPMLGSSSGLVWFALAPEPEQQQLRNLLATSRHSINRQRVGDAAFLESLTGPVREGRYAIQPPPTDMPERSISVPILVDGAMSAVLLMVYMPRALKPAIVLDVYLPMLRTLAERIGDRAGRHDASEHEAGGVFSGPLALTS